MLDLRCLTELKNMLFWKQSCANVFWLECFLCTEQSRWRCMTGTGMAGDCKILIFHIHKQFNATTRFDMQTIQSPHPLIRIKTSLLEFKFVFPFLFFFVLFSSHFFLPSHDFIGDFTTSYRELARGQSQFNVYEVSHLAVPTVQQYVCSILKHGIPVWEISGSRDRYVWHFHHLTARLHCFP